MWAGQEKGARQPPRSDLRATACTWPPSSPSCSAAWAPGTAARSPATVPRLECPASAPGPAAPTPGQFLAWPPPCTLRHAARRPGRGMGRSPSPSGPGDPKPSARLQGLPASCVAAPSPHHALTTSWTTPHSDRPKHCDLRAPLCPAASSGTTPARTLPPPLPRGLPCHLGPLNRPERDRGPAHNP